MTVRVSQVACEFSLFPAWVLGGADPVSGTVSLYETIRGFGTLLRKGWRPLRTSMFELRNRALLIVPSCFCQLGCRRGKHFCPSTFVVLTLLKQGGIGSVEYGEDFASWISEHVVAYINVDTSSSGSQWIAAASPSLAQLIKQTALDVPHPSGDGRTLWDARQDEGPFTPNETTTMDPEALLSYEAEKEAKQSSGTGIDALGSGSDYTVFLQRLGVSLLSFFSIRVLTLSQIASVDQGFVRTPTDAVYHDHSIYDSLRWQEQYADPNFSHHVSLRFSSLFPPYPHSLLSPNILVSSP